MLPWIPAITLSLLSTAPTLSTECMSSPVCLMNTRSLQTFTRVSTNFDESQVRDRATWPCGADILGLWSIRISIPFSACFVRAQASLRTIRHTGDSGDGLISFVTSSRFHGAPAPPRFGLRAGETLLLLRRQILLLY